MSGVEDLIVDSTPERRPIRTTRGLLNADWTRVELAKVTIRKPEPGHQYTGRVVARPNGTDLRLRYRGRTYEIGMAREWSLTDYQPVTSDYEKRLIREQWDLGGGDER